MCAEPYLQAISYGTVGTNAFENNLSSKQHDDDSYIKCAISIFRLFI